jgi:uncharacterized protein YqeY
MTDVAKQAVTGFRVVNFQVKKVKDGEVVKLLLEANVDSIGAGEHDMGDVLKALLHHQTGDTDVGLSVFVQNGE